MRSSFLITGGNGFLGSALASALRLQYSVTTVSRVCNYNDSSCLTFNQVLDEDYGDTLVREIAPSCIIHCAAIAHRPSPRTKNDNRALNDVNINLALSFANLAKRVGVRRFVFISSIGVHGTNSYSSHPITESSPICPSNAYARSKSAAEKLLVKCLQGSECGLSIIRPVLVYGAGMPGNFRLLVRGLDFGCPFPVGLVNNRRSFIALENLISSIEIVSLHPKAVGQAYVVADQESLSTADLIRTIALIRRKPCNLICIPSWLMHFLSHFPLVGGKISQLINNFVVDTSKIRNELGWRQPVSQRDAMKSAFSISQ